MKIRKCTRAFLLTLLVVLTVAFVPVDQSFAASEVKISKCKISLSKTSFIYDGKGKCPKVTVKYKGKVQKKSSSYSLRYYDTKQPGTAKIVIKGKGKFTGSVTKKYTISVGKVSNLKATYNADSSSIKLIWDKPPKCSSYSITAKKDGKTLSSSPYSCKSTSYTLNNIDDVGEYSFSVKAIGGTKKKSSASRTVNLTVGLEAQSISATGNYTKTIGQESFNLNATAKTKLSYKSSNTSVATVDSTGNVSLVGTGSANISVSASKTDKYLGASKTVGITVNKLSSNKLNISSPGYRRIDLSWNIVTGAHGYNIKETVGTSSSSKTYQVSADSLATTYYNKTSGTKYSYSIQPYAVVNGKTYTGSWSSTVSAKAAGTRIGQAMTGEKGSRGNVAGDQTGREVKTCAWSYSSKSGSYKHWQYMARFNDPALAEKAAQLMEDACANDNIGYDQGRNLTMTNIAKSNGYNIAAITTKCDTDCVCLVSVCINGAIGKWTVNGLNPKKNMLSKLRGMSAYLTVYSDSKYLSKDTYLQRGDILWSVDGCHCCIVL